MVTQYILRTCDDIDHACWWEATSLLGFVDYPFLLWGGGVRLQLHDIVESITTQVKTTTDSVVVC